MCRAQPVGRFFERIALTPALSRRKRGPRREGKGVKAEFAVAIGGPILRLSCLSSESCHKYQVVFRLQRQKGCRGRIRSWCQQRQKSRPQGPPGKGGAAGYAAHQKEMVRPLASSEWRMQTGNVMQLTKERKQQLKGEFGRGASDSGSPEIQIALLTSRIAQMTDHLQLHSKDYASRRGLLGMVSRRRRLLDYVKRINPEKYLDLLKRLEIRK
jgi:small subunit ribosomal protein S15